MILIVPCYKIVPTSFLKEKTNISVYYDFDSPMLQNIAYQFSEGQKIIYQFIMILIVPYYKIVPTSCATALFPGVRGGGAERGGEGAKFLFIGNKIKVIRFKGATEEFQTMTANAFLLETTKHVIRRRFFTALDN